MPTARELLEQADALMRRNRSPLMDDIPVLTDAVPVPTGRPQRDRPPPESSEPDTIPMLTEIVPSGPSTTPASPGPANGAVTVEGEPSDWLQTGGREPSVIGDAPDSIVIVPPVVDEVREEIVVEAPLEVEEAFDEELAQRAGVPPPSAPIHTEAEPHVVAAEPISVSPPPAAEMLAWEEDTVIDAQERSATDDDLAPVETEPAQRAETPLVPATAVDHGPGPAERQAAEDARWAAVAEEIRMQVLQRIDLFTDTGLRAQLGARLQPIVDRASADLVATINQHVGELLRAYVAEAIEREIESWKRNN